MSKNSPSTNLPAMLDRVYEERYTGQMLLHFKDGIPLEVELLNRKHFYLTPPPPRPTLETARSSPPE